MGKIITFGSEGRRKILEGMIEAEKAIIVTLGPKGHTVILDNKTIHPKITKDGVTVLYDIDFDDPYKQLGVNIIRDATHKVNSDCGDGSTTTTILSVELCKAGNELINQNFDSVDVKRGFQKAAADIISVIEKNKKVIDSEDDILHVATISANNDEEIGEYVKEAFVNVGENGIVNAMVAKNRRGETCITYSSGFEIARGFISSVSVNTNNESVVYQNPKYFVYGKKLESIKEIEPVFSIARNENIVIVAPTYSDEFKAQFIENVESGRITSVMIGPCGSSHEIMDDNLIDIAKVTGATIIEGKYGKSINTFNQTYLGSSESITANVKKVVISGGKGKPEDIEAHIKDIQAKIESGNTGSDEESMSEYELRYLSERIATLSGGVATIWIGGFSDAEVKEKYYRYEDAIHAVTTAIRDGILVGGGAGLLHAVKEVKENHTRLHNATQEVGYQKFLKIMEMPARIIIKSTGKDPGYYSEKIKENPNKNYGYNAKTETFSDDLFKDGVIDPVKVEIEAIQYGTSVSGTFITSDCVITPNTYNCGVVANDEIIDREMEDFNGIV